MRARKEKISPDGTSNQATVRGGADFIHQSDVDAMHLASDLDLSV
jgi:hypothetical protein